MLKLSYDLELIKTCFCQTSDFIFRLGVEFVLALSQEEEEQQQQQQPPTKIYQWGVY